jgi:hypothetical protein
MITPSTQEWYDFAPGSVITFDEVNDLYFITIVSEGDSIKISLSESDESVSIIIYRVELNTFRSDIEGVESVTLWREGGCCAVVISSSSDTNSATLRVQVNPYVATWISSMKC